MRDHVLWAVWNAVVDLAKGTWDEVSLRDMANGYTGKQFPKEVDAGLRMPLDEFIAAVQELKREALKHGN